MKVDEDYVKICLLNAVFYDHDQVSSEKLIEIYKNKYIVFMDFKHPTWGIKPDKLKEALKWAKNSLKWLKEGGYVTVELESNGAYISRPTQLLFDSDEFPIGFKKKEL